MFKRSQHSNYISTAAEANDIKVQGNAAVEILGDVFISLYIFLLVFD